MTKLTPHALPPRVVLLQFDSVGKALDGGTLQVARALSPLGTNMPPPEPSQKARRHSNGETALPSFGCLLHPEQTAAAAQLTTAPTEGGLTRAAFPEGPL